MSRLMEDLRSIPSTASTSQEDHESNSGSTSSRKLRVTLLSSEWRSTKGGLSTINRELAIQLAKQPSVEVSVYLPQCSEKDKRAAASHSVTLIEAEEMPGLEPDLWLSCLPEDHAVDCVIGHGAVLGRQVQIIKRHHHCKWIQVVHTAPEELGMYKSYADAILRGEKKHQAEVKLCEKADEVVAVGPKLAEAFSGYLRACGKDQDVLNLTPGIFSEFSDVKQATEERKTFSVLVFGRGDNEDFQLKGYDIASRAIAELKDEPQPYKLLFVGAPSGEEEKVKDLLLQQGVDRSQLTVRCFNESREQLARLFCEVDLAIMPSRTEGFGLAALEALSAGLPVLVSGNSGLGEALKEVPNGSHCVVESEDPEDWANAIKAVRKKKRKLRLREAKILQGEYAEIYRWQDHCNRLVQRMLAISQGPSADEQNLSKKATVICHDEKPSPTEKHLYKGSAKKRQSSKKGKRPLSSSNILAPKYPRLLKDEGWYISVVVKLLKAEYNRRSHLRPIFWDSTFELPLDDVYTRLKIVSRRKADLRVEDNEVNVFDIFTALDKGEDVMTLVEGSPGIGKTTFCLKLAYDWAHGKIPAECSFPKFEIVLLLKCRDIHKDVMETITEQLLPEDMEGKTKERLFDFIKDIHNQEKTLIILDGLDELPQESLRYVDKLLQRRILSFCYVLATSRQERGIDVRRKYCFDILLEIKGFTESDAFEYIRRHFKYVDPFHSLKGESLIKEIKENTLLHALRNNPLNLLLLCVVFEDYEGKLPSSRTELYHIIVLCLLRRYCAKHNLEAPKDNSALEKQFKQTILALGELAWICLLSDRYCFREDELGEIESRYNGLVAREIGLLYKEESLKRLKPQHEYYFLHKTFQEYLAASYIVQRLRKQQFNVFEHLTFNEFVEKYPQVFIFVSGMLGEKATVLFTQIGEELKKSYDWNWNEHCSEEAATFFIESFSESGHAEQVAATLCNIIPFPKVITPELMYEDEYNYSFVQVLTACRSFLTLQAPAELHAYSFGGDEAAVAITYMESCSQLTTVSLVLESLESSDAERLRQCFSKNKNLSEFTLKVKWKNKDGVPLPSIGIGLASCQTLTNVTFAFPGYAYSEGFFNALETGLAPLESVVFEIRGSTSDTAILALQKFLSNKSLKSLSLCIFGDVQDFLVAAFSEAFAGQTVLKSLDLRLNGPLSSSGAKFLEKGLLNNNSLNFLRVCVLGEPPGNWQSVVENLHLAKTSLVACSIYPNTWNNLTYSHFHPVLIEKGLHLKQHLTVNFWGEISCKTAEVFCNVLAASSITFLTLNMHGNVTSEVAISIAKCLEGCRTLSFLSINIWGMFTTEGSTVLSRLSESNVSVKLNVHDVRICPDEGNDVLDISIDNPAALRAFFAEVRNTRREKVSLTINGNGYVTKEWTRCLGDALAESTSLTSLDLTVNSYSVDADLGEKLGNSLLQSNSLTSLSLLFNCSNMEEGWLCNLGDCLDKMASLTTLGFRVDNYGEWSQRDLFRLMRMKSLSTLSVAIHDISMDSFWNGIVGICLRECTSLTKLSLTFNVDYLEYSSFGLDDGLAITSSLQALSLAIFVDDGSYDYSFPDLFRSLNEGLSLNASVTTLTVTLTLTEPVLFNYPWIFREGLSLNKSITRLNLAIHEYGEGKSDIPKLLRNCGVFESLAQSTSVTTFNLTLSSSKEVNDGWLPVLCEALDRNSSLTTLRLHCKSHCATGGGRLYDFSKLLVKSRSLSLLEREVSFYGKDNES